jgi:hypothetical protein
MQGYLMMIRNEKKIPFLQAMSFAIDPVSSFSIAGYKKTPFNAP